jgi:hypothetical protein
VPTSEGAAMKHMRLVCAALVFIGMGSGVLAQGRPLTLQMSCTGARQLVASQWAVVLNTGPTTYDRYVAAMTQCVRGDTLDPAWVPTADTPQCSIGYRCVPRTRPAGGG